MLYEGGAYFPYAFGCTLGVKAALHNAVGGFDELFTNGCEDADYCWRLQLEGADLVFFWDVVTHYRHRDDLLGIYRQARDYGAAETLLYLKHRPLGLPYVPRPLSKAIREWLATIRAFVSARDRGGLAFP